MKNFILNFVISGNGGYYSLLASRLIFPCFSGQWEKRGCVCILTTPDNYDILAVTVKYEPVDCQPVMNATDQSDIGVLLDRVIGLFSPRKNSEFP